MADRTYYCIDMKTFYASVECAERHLNPFETNLVVADASRGANALCLAISPKLKAQGVRNRCRMSEIPPHIKYITAPPRMALYVEYAADIYGMYLDYFSPDDMHVYSIDETFIDATDYLKLYRLGAMDMASRLMNEIALRLHIPSTAGIGTNLYLAKIALDISAKHTKEHMAYLNEELYRETLWHHRPLTDFWQIAQGTARRLSRFGALDMAGIAALPEETLYRTFGRDAELLIDHVWGREPCTMQDIKNYKGKSKSVSSSQILPRNYTFDEARIVLREMAMNGAEELMKRGVITHKIGVYVGYAFETRQPDTGGITMTATTNLGSFLQEYALRLFDRIADRITPIRHLGISFEDVCDSGCEGYDLFTDFDAVEKEKKVAGTMMEVHAAFGKNALLRGTDFMPGATQRERNTFIGGAQSRF